MAEILGIDLGTTNSGGAVWRDGAPHIIPDAGGYPLTPSVVARDPATGDWLVGRQARVIREENPGAAIYSIKRLMGRRFSEEVVQDDLHKRHILYEVEESRRRRDAIEVPLGELHLTPQEVSAKILQKIKADAEAHLGHEISQAVITVPAYFHDSQRQATRDAGRIAGLDVKRVLNEPTAACLAFAYQRLNEARKTLAVYDLGGGTFDISILEVGRGPFRVRATNGDTRLGGDDLDRYVADWALKQIGGEEEKRLREDVRALARLRAAAERAKIALSMAEEVTLEVPGLLNGASGSEDLALTLTRTTLEGIANEEFIPRTLAPCANALRDARLNASDLAEVLLVGGQTRMPAIREAVRDFFGIEPNISVNPEEVVALGAAVQAAILAGEATGLKLINVVPLTLGVGTRGVMDALIPRNTPVPVVKTRVYSTVENNQESVEVAVFQGERPAARDNEKLGSFILKGIEPAPHGEPEIEVTFRVDQDGILHVTGKDLRSGNYQEITITDSVRFSDEEIEAMIRDAEAHAAEYAAQRRQLEARHQAEALAERLTQTLADKEGEWPAELTERVKDALAAPAPEDWAARLSELEALWRQIGDRPASAPAGGGETAAGST
jgi:molecular chaperone DnaK